MFNDAKVTLATEHEIRESIADIRSALLDGPILPNIWGFYSPKNEKLITLLGDVTFIQAVLLEGDPDVTSYSVQSEIDSDEDHTFGRLLLVQKMDGAIDWLFCCRHESTTKSGSSKFKKILERERNRAAKAGGQFVVRTENDFASRITEFWNWLALCTAMTRARDFNKEDEFSILAAHLQKQKSCSFHGAMGMANVDPALMVATIAKQLAIGLLKCDLKNQPLNQGTEFWLGDAGNRCVTPATKPETRITATSKLLPTNRRTSFVPEMWRDLSSWPAPDPNSLADPDVYRRNKNGVEMYFANRDFFSIKQATGLGEDWVRELAKKCFSPHHDGRIFGYRALVRYSRKSGYHRRAPIAESNIHEGNKGGYAGAMTSLFVRFPHLLTLIESSVLQTRKNFEENPLTARVRWVDLKSEVHQFLREKGLGENDYPFNTRDQGYATVAELGRSLLFKRPLKFIKSRYGRDATRLAEVRHGESPLIQPTASFQILEADFHKHDSAATVELESPIGGTVDATVPRFWIGCAVDAYQRAILATTDSFEPQTSESCVLDLIDAAIAPPDPIEELRELKGCEDGYWQPNQILPEFAWHAWDIIKLDRAWAHKSTNVLSKLISSVGCAVCFGRPRAWWSRSIVERTFRELTSRGVQRLSTTFGTGPNDPRRDKPEEKAIAIRLRRNEICILVKSIVREINCSVREGNFWESSIDVLKRSNSQIKYFPRPIPLQRKLDRPTLWVTLQEKIEAYPEKGIKPSVRVKGCRYYGNELGCAWSLVGEKIIVEVARHDIRIARIINPRTGEIIGAVKPEKRWQNVQITWQNFVLLQKFGRIKRNHQRPENATEEFIENRRQKIFGKGAKNPSEAKKAASELSKIEQAIKKEESNPDNDSTSLDSKSLDESGTESTATANQQQGWSLSKLLGKAPEIESFSRD
jgi:putative transposase